VSQREINQLAKILTDPENSSRSAEEVAVLVLDKMYDLAVSTAKAEIRTETRREIFDKDSEARRLAVVGQISYGPQEPTRTVVLGPFYASRPLSSEERFREVVKLPNTQAREAGQHLAWDSKTGRHRGRFMLVPAFMKPREAWDFYRGQEAAEIAFQAVEQFAPHLGPVCGCGLLGRTVCRWCHTEYERHCPLHDEGAQVHQCRTAA
jgi:hypothetical protein